MAEPSEEEAALYAQEKQKCILLLQRELKNPLNFVELHFGIGKWPDPVEVRMSLNQHSKELLIHLRPATLGGGQR